MSALCPPLCTRNGTRSRPRRKRLQGEWGVVDVRDCATAATQLAAGPGAGPSQPPPQSQPPVPFPGAGHTLGAAPAPTGTGRGAGPASSQQAGSRHPESAIATLIGLGATREIAIASLDAAGGNLDVAASLLFQ